MNPFINKDPKGRDPFGPPYIFFHRYEWEEDHTMWMNRIDAEIAKDKEECKKALYEDNNFTKDELRGCSTGFITFFIISILFWILVKIFN